MISAVCVKLDTARLVLMVKELPAATELMLVVGVLALGMVGRDGFPDTVCVPVPLPRKPPKSRKVPLTATFFFPSALWVTQTFPEARIWAEVPPVPLPRL